jgi:hypothetical protein
MIISPAIDVDASWCARAPRLHRYQLDQVEHPVLASHAILSRNADYLAAVHR